MIPADSADSADDGRVRIEIPQRVRRSGPRRWPAPSRSSARSSRAGSPWRNSRCLSGEAEPSSGRVFRTILIYTHAISVMSTMDSIVRRSIRKLRASLSSPRPSRRKQRLCRRTANHRVHRTMPSNSGPGMPRVTGSAPAPGVQEQCDQRGRDRRSARHWDRAAARSSRSASILVSIPCYVPACGNPRPAALSGPSEHRIRFAPMTGASHRRRRTDPFHRVAGRSDEGGVASSERQRHTLSPSAIRPPRAGQTAPP